MTPPRTDATHDPGRRSFVEGADRHPSFPIQNLAFGVFRSLRHSEPRIGVAIGDHVLDLRGCVEAALLDELSGAARCALSASSLNDFLGLGHDVWSDTRRAVQGLLDAETPVLRDDAARRDELLLQQDAVEMVLPVKVGDYTDFYCSIHHATNVGAMFRPDNPLLPNYPHLPIGYHGRASSLVVSGTPIRRPSGQVMPAGADAPTRAPSRLLDYELEMGFYVGPGNAMGRSIAMAEANDHIFGLTLVNDWSARDVQKWEYQPLGPFNAKNFATTVAPWVVTLDALAPFRVPGEARRPDDPPVLDYLRPADDFGLDVTVEVHLSSATMREKGMAPLQVSRGSFRTMYWTIAQMLVHHTSTGCNLRPGDLIASGTISGPDEESRGCLLERTWRGEKPLELPDGTKRKFLDDGDEVVLAAYAEREGFARIGLGECRGTVLSA